MNQALIFYPVLAQMFLIVGLYLLLLVRKKSAVRGGEADLKRARLHEDGWPDAVLQVNNNLRNQFQLPVMFYVVALMLFALQAVDILAIALAWLFVASRALHAYIHTTSNYVPYRRSIFIVGNILLVLMMLLVLLALIAGS